MEDKRLLSEIQSLSESIRQKHRALKRGIADATSTLEKTFQPLTEPLKTLTKRLEDKTIDVNRQELVKSEQTKEENDDVIKDVTPKRRTPSFLPTHTVVETPPPPPTPLDVSLTSPEGRRESLEWLHTLPYGTLAREYMTRFVTDTQNDIDNTYGPHLANDKLMIGDGELTFEKTNDLYIKGTRYTGTQGLYELLFMKRPDEGYVTDNDRRAYKSIMIATNAHKQRYDPEKQINANSSHKYRHVIRQLFGYTGRGLPTHKTAGTVVDYVRWNDVNELVDRLRLLVASRAAGHSGHDNEILSILEELREAKVIA